MDATVAAATRQLMGSGCEGVVWTTGVPVSSCTSTVGRSTAETGDHNRLCAVYIHKIIRDSSICIVRQVQQTYDTARLQSLTLSQGNLDSQDHCIKEAPIVAETHNINEQAPTQLHWEKGGLEWTTWAWACKHRVHQSLNCFPHLHLHNAQFCCLHNRDSATTNKANAKLLPSAHPLASLAPPPHRCRTSSKW